MSDPKTPNKGGPPSPTPRIDPTAAAPEPRAPLTAPAPDRAAPPADAPPPRSLADKLFPKAAEPLEANEVKDLPAKGVTTTQAPTAEEAPKADLMQGVRLRVWEGDHSAEAAIVKDNDDDTFDLSADIWHTGQPITLIGVKRRAGGQGNGWEVIDVAEEAKAKVDAPHDEREGTNPNRVSLALVRLTIIPPFNGELQIGHTTYAVSDGVVEAAPWDADAARAAGYTG